MHLLLTDRLTCPRCGPGFGLILRADHLVDRRVLEGALGCPNCRDHFPITNGFADLRSPPRAALDSPIALIVPDPADTDRLAALLGITEGPGNVALVGVLAAHAESIADRVPDVEVLAVAAELRCEPERGGVSRMMIGADFPFLASTLRAVAFSGGPGDTLLDRPTELSRVVPRGGRIIVEGPAPDAAERIAASGARVLARDERWLVAIRETG